MYTVILFNWPDVRTHPLADPHTEKKVYINYILYIYIYIIMVILIVVMIRRNNDFTIINLVHITPIGINSNLL